MRHVVFAFLVACALAVMSQTANAQCGYTTYYAPAPQVTYYAAPTVAYAPAYTTYYSPRPYWSGYRYYSYSPTVYYYGW